MFIVTNREVFEGEQKKTGPDRFGKGLNPLGANELRLAEAVRTRTGWSVTIIPDQAILGSSRPRFVNLTVPGRALAGHEQSSGPTNKKPCPLWRRTRVSLAGKGRSCAAERLLPTPLLS